MSALAKMLVGQEINKMAPGMGDPIVAMLMRNRGGGGGGTGGVGMPGSLGNVADYQQFAKKKARQMFGKGHGAELEELWNRESGWNPKADNPTSTAYGIPQFLDSTRKNYGLDLNAGPKAQIKAGLRYIADRYRNPTKALEFHDQKNWY